LEASLSPTGSKIPRLPKRGQIANLPQQSLDAFALNDSWYESLLVNLSGNLSASSAIGTILAGNITEKIFIFFSFL
jgi:hypothetical protein